MSTAAHLSTAAHASDASFRRLADHAPCILWSAAIDGSWTYVNPAWTRLTGQPVEQALGWGWLERVPAPHRRRLKSAFTKAAVVASPWELVHGVSAADGGVREVHTQVQPSFEANDQFVGFSGTCTWHREVDGGEPAGAGEDDFGSAHMLELLPYAVMAYDSELRYVYANRAAGQLFGIEPHAFAGKGARELGVAPYIATAYEQAAAQAMASRTPQNFDYRIDTGDDTRYFRVSVVPDPLGARAVAVTSDVTSWVQAQVELDALVLREQAARTQAETAANVRDQFLAMVSHELRSPLNGIQSWAHVLESRVDVNQPGVARALAGIKTGVQQQVGLIEELLDVTQAMTGRLRFSKTLLSLSPAVQGALAKAERLAAERGVALRAELPATQVQVWGNGERVEQMVGHLVTNAIKFSAQGSEVSVRVAVAGNEACIAVGDTGKGISSDVMPYLFDPFRHQDALRARRAEGLGVGLTLVRHLAELHGGRVAAQSAGEGQGAVFSIYLPLAKEGAQAVPAPPEMSAASSLDGLRILLIEDHDEGRTALTESLRSAGADVVACDSGGQALRYLGEASGCGMPHVIVSDLTMPGMDGCATLCRIRELERGAPDRFPMPTPAIALTSATQAEDRIRALASGFQVYLAKPVEFFQLAGLIQSLARTASLERR